VFETLALTLALWLAIDDAPGIGVLLREVRAVGVMPGCCDVEGGGGVCAGTRESLNVGDCVAVDTTDGITTALRVAN
jgi:hypothetical protein